MDAVTVPVIAAPAKKSLGYNAGPIRDITLPLIALVLTMTLSFRWIIMLYVVIGQAHFILAYLYQYRGKRMNRRYLLAAALLLGIAILYFVFDGSIFTLLLIIGVLFSAHFAYDEITLHDEQPTKENLAAVVSFTILFASFVVALAIPMLAWVPVACVALAVGITIVRLLVSRVAPSHAERYLWCLAVLLLVLAFVLHHTNAVLGVIVLLHTANWYVGYGMRLRSRPERARQYWREVAITLGLSACLFFVYLQFHTPVLGVFFALAPYYAWAVAHILLSFVTLIPNRIQAA